MLLYHYSKNPLKTLTTRRFRETLTDEQLKEGWDSAVWRKAPGPYYDHISFFLEPAPLDILGAVFADVNHDFWIPGSTIYQHTVESSKIGRFKYAIVETPGDIELLSEWKDEWDMDPKWDAAKETYFFKRARIKKANGEVGQNNAAFEQVASSFVGTARQAYLSALNRDQNDRLLYAAGVPHVMIYPAHGELKLTAPAIKVKIGPANASLEGYPASSRW